MGRRWEFASIYQHWALGVRAGVVKVAVATLCTFAAVDSSAVASPAVTSPAVASLSVASPAAVVMASSPAISIGINGGKAVLHAVQDREDFDVLGRRRRVQGRRGTVVGGRG